MLASLSHYEIREQNGMARMPAIFMTPLPSGSGVDLSCCTLSRFQFSSVAQSHPIACDPMDCSMPGLSVHHQLPELVQTQVNRVGDAIQPSHPLLSPSSPAFSLSQHQGLFHGVSSSHQVAKVLQFQLQH